MGQALVKCIDPDYVEPIACNACSGTGICRECKGEGGWTRPRDVLRNEKRKVIGDNGEPKYMDAIVYVDIPEHAVCPLCGQNSTPSLQVNATNRSISPFAAGNQYHAGKEASHKYEVSLHPGDGSPSKGSWKGTGKCQTCMGTGKIEPVARRLAFE